MSNLTINQLCILKALDDEGGFTTAQTAIRAGIQYGHSRRSTSALVRERLMELKAAGYVRFLDDQKPVCWVRTPAGSAALTS